MTMNIYQNWVRRIHIANRLISSRVLSILAMIVFSGHACGIEVVADHLVPLKKQQGVNLEYEKLWRRKLLVSPGDLAQFVGLPGNVGEETAVSVYRQTQQDNTTAGYWVTATQAKERLSKAIPQLGVDGTVDPQNISIERCDAALPESTAIAIHDLWVAMLSQTSAEPKSESISIDSSTEIFSAVDASGKVLRGQTSRRPGKNSLALVQLALSLMEYCDAPASQRVGKAREIKKVATDLLSRITQKASSNNTRLGKSEKLGPHYRHSGGQKGVGAKGRTERGRS